MINKTWHTCGERLWGNGEINRVQIVHFVFQIRKQRSFVSAGRKRANDPSKQTETVVSTGINYASLPARAPIPNRVSLLNDRINRVRRVNRKEGDAFYWLLPGNIEDGQQYQKTVS